MKPFGERIKSARKMAGMSLQDLSNKVGVSKQALSRYELEVMKPKPEMVIKISNATGLPFDFFYREPSGIKLEDIHFNYNR